MIIGTKYLLLLYSIFFQKNNKKISKQTEPLSAVFASKYTKQHMNSEQQGFCTWGGLVTPLLDSKEFLTEQRGHMSAI